MRTAVRILIAVTLFGLLVAVISGVLDISQEKHQARAAEAEYVVLAWNDLGMHCYNRDFQDLAVLPPFNTLWAQVVKVGDPPQIITNGVRVKYSFPDNTYSVGKSNFWDYDEQLFGVDLPPNTGLAGKKLAGRMDRKADHFVAEGIPLTEFRDSDLINPYPYQLAEVVAYDTATNQELARSTVVAPVSTEMNCDDCHYDGGVEDITTGRVETNILTLHDEENLDEYPPGHEGALMDRRPILCAECHASNALQAPGVAGIPNLSNAMHDAHSEEVPSNLEGCYKCHPGPQTQCLRDVMYEDYNMDCVDCHGDMEDVAQNPDPWLIEPRCDNEACHGSAYAQDHPLYRLSTEHGGLYCASCHDSPHAIAPGREANDAIKFLDLQGTYDTLQTCTVCHLTAPQSGGPHEAAPPSSTEIYVSGNSEHRVSGIAYTRSDILRWDESSGWSLYFDASDVGISGSKDLHAFTILDDGSLLLVFDRGLSLPGLSPRPKPWDIVQFVPTELGADTRGTFQWYFDGSDVGLSTTGEKIDALDVQDGKIYLSTSGSFAVASSSGRLRGKDEDILEFTPAQLGQNTQGSWRLAFDGSAVPGLGVEDIASLSMNALEQNNYSIYISTTNAFTIAGVSGNQKEILHIYSCASGACAEINWRGPDFGFMKNIDGQHRESVR